MSNALVNALCNPAFYPHSVARIEIVETHISWVFLTGAYAYKIKKPVDFGFVNFSTLAQRRDYCADELRLNRRLAPELYLEVIAIGGTPEAPRYGLEPAFEYAVKMCQFKQEQLLSHLAYTNRLESAHIDLLAREIAEFHRRIAGPEVPSDYGQPNQIQRWTEQNFIQLLPLLAMHQAETLRARLDALHDWTRQTQKSLRTCFSMRLQQGFVRECHGDLHLGNIVLLDDQIRLFDCIEFNPELRWIDVFNDLGFIIMDVYDRNMPRLARRLLNRYLAHSGDYGGLQVLPFYMVYRAVVRAKVGLLRLHQEDLSNSERDHIWHEFNDYLKLASDLSRVAQPTLYITHGLAGSGKSTVATELSEQLDVIHIRADVERKRLHGLDPWQASGDALNNGIYSEHSTQRTYKRLAELAESILQAGFSCVVDATFLRRWQRDIFRNLAARKPWRFVILDLQAPLALLRQRIETRRLEQDDPSEATLDVLAAQQESQEHLSVQESPLTVMVPVSQRPDFKKLLAGS